MSLNYEKAKLRRPAGRREESYTSRKKHPTKTHDEIDADLKAFLERGGKIKVLE